MSDELLKGIQDILEDFKNEVEENVDKLAEKTAKLAVKELKATSPVGDYAGGGAYAKSWHYKKTKMATGYTQYTVYNAKHYRLTHLLENGHLIRNKNGTYGRTKAIPHIKPVELIVQNDFFENLRRTL